jgi:hypothetical protein
LYAVSTYQTSGQFDAAMQEWHAKLLTDKTIPNFPVYIQNKYTKMVKRNRSTAGAVGKGIANKATEEKFSDAKAQAMVIAKVANVLQAQNAEQIKNMMAMFEKLLASTQALLCLSLLSHPRHPVNPARNAPTAARNMPNTRSVGNLTPRRLSGRQTGSPPRPLLDGVRRMSPLSSGSRVR